MLIPEHTEEHEELHRQWLVGLRETVEIRCPGFSKPLPGEVFYDTEDEFIKFFDGYKWQKLCQ